MTNINSDTEEDLYYFESDHLALKGNKDYSELLKTIFVLESQRARAIKDYDKVVELHKKALDDPLAFIQKLKNKESLDLPELQVIAEVPNVHWSKYKIEIPKEGLKFIKENNDDDNSVTNFEEEQRKLQEQGNTYNKPWTIEEQKRLEELLYVYPPEPIESRRYKKIAKALGNRTEKQVSSRIQKYFLKLYKAGLPIPGRIPKYAERSKKTKLHVHQRYNHYLFKPTTFFPQLNIPVTMNENEDVPGPSNEGLNNNSVGNYLIPNSLDPSNENSSEGSKNDLEAQLNILHQVKLEKQEESHYSSLLHMGYKCNFCNEEPLIGTRWHCKNCPFESVDFCTDCIVAQMYSETPHPLSHTFFPIRNDYSNEDRTNSSNSSCESVSESGADLESSNEMSANESDESQTTDIAKSNFEIKTENANFEADYMNLQQIMIKKEDTLNYEMDDEDQQTVSNNVHFNTNNFTETQNVSYSYLHSNLLLDT